MKLPKIFSKIINIKRRNSSKNSTSLSTELPESTLSKFIKSFKNITKKCLKNGRVALLYAIIFTLPIYVNIFTYASIDITNNKSGIFLPYVNTIFALISIFVILKIDKKYRFFFGFFVGILWFYWMTLSFTHSYTSINHFIPISLLIIGVVYGIVFYFLLFFNNKFWRIFTLSIIGYIAIFGFDWLVIESIFAFSIFRVDKISFIFIMICVAIFSIITSKKRFLALGALILAIDFSYVDIKIPPNIFISQMDVDQQIKWTEDRRIVTERNFSLIDEAIENSYKMVILPETAFPFALNFADDVLEYLLEKSHNITIVTGSWKLEDGKFFNSTYIFENGTMQIKSKTFLAPFGEYVPLPEFMVRIFSKITGLSYNLQKNTGGLNDVVTDIFSFRSAICYEATKRDIYSDNPTFMVVISNNAWFYPSIEPILQMMIIKYYARLYKTLVIHTTNGSKSMIISPNTSLKFIANF